MEPTISEVVPQIPEVKKDNHWVTILAMALFVLTSLSVVAFLYYQNQALKKMLASYQTPVSSPTPTATANPTASWKTYTYDKYGYSFKYPSEYTVEERVPGFLVVTSPGETAAQAGISVDSRLQGPHSSYSNAKKVITTTNDLTVSKTASGWEIFQGMGKDGMLKGIEFRFGIAPYKTGAIAVETLANTQYVNVFDQILSTFHFLK